MYVIVDKGTLDTRGLRVREFARVLREAGVMMVQYRDKVGGPQEVLRRGAEVAEAFAGSGALMVMNDRVDLAMLMGWGVHVGQGDLPTDAAVEMLEKRRFPSHPSEQVRSPRTPASGMTTKKGERWLVGVSTHNEEQVLEADAGVADYVAVGPVFGTRTKRDAEAVVGLEGVRRARALTTKPLVAIGGIALENCVSVMEAGADSVAVISGVFVEGRGVGEVVRDFLERLR